MRGIAFVVGGLISIAAALVNSPARVWVMVVALMISSIVPVVYSYIIWRREAPGHS